METNTRQYFDADKLIRDIYNKIVAWHNNDERLNEIEMGRELRFLSKDIAEDVLKAVHGQNIEITLDRHKLGMTESEMKQNEEEREKRRMDIQNRIREEGEKNKEHQEQVMTDLENQLKEERQKSS